jgi:hypothetical protein
VARDPGTGQFVSAASFDEQLRAQRAARRIPVPWEREPAPAPIPAGTFTNVPQPPDPMAGADFLMRAVHARRAASSEALNVTIPGGGS